MCSLETHLNESAGANACTLSTAIGLARSRNPWWRWLSHSILRSCFGKYRTGTPSAAARSRMACATPASYTIMSALPLPNIHAYTFLFFGSMPSCTSSSDILRFLARSAACTGCTPKMWSPA